MKKSILGVRMEARTGGSEKAFRQVLQSYLNALAMKQGPFADEADLTRPQVNGWLLGKRRVSRRSCNHLAHTITRLADTQLAKFPTISADDDSPSKELKERRHRLESISVDKLDGVLNELLTAAGYSAVNGTGADLIWNRIARERDTLPEDQHTYSLRVAWFPWPPLARRNEKDPTDEGPCGLVREIGDQVAQLSGMHFKYRRFELPEIAAALQNRDVDLVTCQYIATPLRMRDFLFSEPIPHLRCVPNAVVHKEHRADLFTRREDPKDWRTFFDKSKVEIARVKSTIAKNMAQLLGLGDVPYQTFDSLGEGWRDVLRKPLNEDGDKVRCFVTESFTVRHAMDQCPDTATSLIPLEVNGREIGLGLSFAALPREERLIGVLNAALNTLKRNDDCLLRLYSEHEELLKEARALTRTGRELLGHAGVEAVFAS